MSKKKAEPEKPERVRVNMRMPSELAEWIRSYAGKKNSTFTQVIVDELTKLQSRESV